MLESLRFSFSGELKIEVTALQRAMLLESEANRSAGLYIVQPVYRFKNLDIEALINAVTLIIGRHEILKSSFTVENEEAFMLTGKCGELEVNEINWTSERSKFKLKERLKKFLKEDRVRNFELGKAPLIRLTVIRTNGDISLVVLTHHHVLMDGFSSPIISGQILKEYQSSVKGIKDVGQYQQVVGFSRYLQWLQNRGKEKDREFWVRYLENYEDNTPQRSKMVKSGYEKSEFDQISIELTAQEVRSYGEVAKECGATLSAVIMGLVLIAYGRLIDSEDYIIGVVFNGRPSELEGIDQMVGMFMNTLPLRAKIKRDAKIIDVIKRVQMDIIELGEHQFLGLNEIVECCSLPKSKRHINVVIDNKLGLTGGNMAGIAHHGDVAKDESTVMASQGVPFHFNMEYKGDNIALTITYESDSYMSEDIKEIIKDILAMGAGVREKKGVKISEVGSLTTEENDILTNIGKGNEVDFPKGKKLHELFNDGLKINPKGVAIKTSNIELTYNEMEQRVNQVINLIRSKATKVLYRVAIDVERSEKLVIVILALLRMGIVFVPLDKRWPRNRIQEIVEDANIDVILSDSEPSESIKSTKTMVINISSYRKYRRTVGKIIRKQVVEDETALILYTSGSTGIPKGVRLKHRSIVSRIHSEQLKPTPEEIFISKTASTFIDFLWEIFLPFSCGCRIVLLNSNECTNIELMIEVMACEKGIRRIVLVPTLMNVILSMGMEMLSELNHIKHWILTGEPLPKYMIGIFFENLPDSRLYNLYGATEVWDISLGEIKKGDYMEDEVNVGRPMPNTLVFIIDKYKNLVNQGKVGRIVVSGEHVGGGYVNKEDMDRSFFILSLNGNDRYCWDTGDQGKWNDRGELEVHGRMDRLVKLRGFRINLDEIENVVLSLKEVRDCAVRIVEDGNIGIAVETDQIDEKDIIINKVKEALPSYLVPTQWILKERFEKLTSGKLDREKIFGDESHKSTQNKPNTVKNDATHRELECLFVETAKEFFPYNNEISNKSNFFEIGGHSLMAVRYIAKLNSITGRKIRLDAIFRFPIISELAVFAASQEKEENSKRGDERERDNALAPASTAQKRLWIVNQLKKGLDTYILTNKVEVKGHLDSKIIKDALRHLISRHPILNTTFKEEAGEVIQYTNDTSTFLNLSLDDGVIKNNNELTDGEIDNKCREGKWSLEDGPLYRVQVKYKQNSTSIILSIHHIIADGASISILYKDLLAIYHNLASLQVWNRGLKPLLSDYREYSIREYDWIHSDEYKKRLEDWVRLLKSDMDSILFCKSVSNKERSIENHHSINLTSEIGLESLRKIKNRASRNKTTVFNILLAIFSIYISRHVSNERVVIGTPSTTRRDIDMEGVVGCFVNLQLYPIIVDEELTFEEFCSQIIHLTRKLLSIGDVDFEHIVKAVQPKRGQDDQPIFQVMLVHEMIEERGEGKAKSKVIDSSYTTEHANYDYVLLVREYQDRLVMTHHVRKSIFSEHVLECMAKRFDYLLNKVLTYYNEKLYRLSMLTQEEESILTIKYNDSGINSKYSGRCMSGIYRDLCNKNEHAKSVVDNGVGWKRTEIANMAGYYQDLIRATDVKNRRTIAICMTKGVHQVALMLAINGLGFRFVPIDPKVPVERKNYILNKAEAGIIFVDNSQEIHGLAKETKILYVDINSKLMQTQNHSFIHNRDGASDAYICFTSGSTGEPKGVVVTNENLSALFYAQKGHFGLNTKSKVLSTLGMYFDAGIGEQVRALLSGAVLYFCGDDLLQNPDKLFHSLKENKITHCGIPPAVLAALDDMGSETLTNLRFLITGGEEISINTARKWGKNRNIITGHGATETTIGDTIAKNWDLDSRAPLGKPLPNMKAYIVDRYHQIVPDYVIGQLVITGPQVARGYAGDEMKTMEYFRESIGSLSSHFRFYLTGDYAFWDSKGDIYFAGRRDKQFKIRGYRIELGEIEKIVRDMTHVQEVVCHVWEQSEGSQIALYYVSSGIHEVDVRKVLIRTLPHYMVPVYIERLNSIPKTSNGKLDYRQLPTPLESTKNRDSSKPTTKVEAKLYKIWKDVLQNSKFGIEDGFFAVGGDSIKAIRVISLCSTQGINLDAKTLFMQQSIKNIAAALEDR